MSRNKLKIGTYGMLFIALILLLPNPGKSSIISLNQSYDQGVFDLRSSSNNEIIGHMVYKSVFTNHTAVTTLEPDYGGIAPFHPYFAESLNVNGTDYYFSNTISGFELFNDLNHNGYIDSSQEIKYFVILNATQGFSFGDITKTVHPYSTVYTWNSSYYDIDGFLLEGENNSNSSLPPGTYTSTTTVTSPFNNKYSSSSSNKVSSNIMKTIISSFNISYKVTEADNYTDLSIKYDIGQWDAFTLDFVNGNEVRTGTVDLSGLGLSLLYTSVISSTKPIQMIDSSSNGVVSDIKVVSDNSVLFHSVLNETYFLNDQLLSLPVKTVIAPPNSFLENQNVQWSISYDYLKDLREWFTQNFTLPGIAPENMSEKEIFNYRISYPEWSGGIITHDPIYRINKGLVSLPIEIPGFPSLSSDDLIVISSITGVLMIVLVLFVEKRRLI